MLEKMTGLPNREQALPGRQQQMTVADQHYVNSHQMKPPFPEDLSQALFGLGCFWGAEKIFWQKQGVYSTAVGYAGGFTPNPSYEEVCSGMTGHNEVVLVVYDSQKIKYVELLKEFWQAHDPSQGMRQGNDVGSQYRSGIYVFDEQQKQLAEQSLMKYQESLTAANRGTITTEIITAPEFYYAEDYHQQYLAKNINGYCGLGGTGVNYPD